jgi:hypothetical protein
MILYYKQVVISLQYISSTPTLVFTVFMNSCPYLTTLHYHKENSFMLKKKVIAV